MMLCRPGASSPLLWQKVCYDVYGITGEKLGANIAATNNYYGGKDPKDISNVLYSNGDLDAWTCEFFGLRPDIRRISA